MADLQDPQTDPQPTPAPAPQPQQPPAGQVIPYDRFQEVVAERNKLQQQIKALQGETSKVQTLEQQLQQLQADLSKERQTALRQKAAAAHNLPLDLVDRLRGENEEDLLKDAEALAKLIPAPQAPQAPASRGVPPSGGGGRPTPVKLSGLTPAQIRERVAKGEVF